MTQKNIPKILNSISEVDLTPYSKVVALIDENIYKKYQDYTNTNFKEVILVPSKEETKNINNVLPILQKLSNMNLDRNSCIVGLGGGVIGDIAGFCASIYMRGIDFIQIPTTFMSMCDHVIGKVAISNIKKNTFGSFYSPRFVIIEDVFLSTMPRLLVTQGLVEVLKHYFITNDKEHSRIVKKENFRETILKIAENKDSLVDRKKAIYISHDIKASFVKNDLYDKKGIHKALSYGHTFANAIESLDQTINHGEAVLKGMELAAKLAYKIKMMKKQDYEHHFKMTSYLSKHLPKIKITSKQLESIINSFKTDKLSSSGKMKFVLLTKIGSYKIVTVNETVIREFLFEEVQR